MRHGEAMPILPVVALAAIGGIVCLASRPGPTADSSFPQHAILTSQLGEDGSQLLEDDGTDHVNRFTWIDFSGNRLSATLRVSIHDAERSLQEWGIDEGALRRIQTRLDESLASLYRAANECFRVAGDARDDAVRAAVADYNSADAAAVDRCNAVLGSDSSTPDEQEAARQSLYRVRDQLETAYQARIERLDRDLKLEQRRCQAEFDAACERAKRNADAEAATELERTCVGVSEQKYVVDPARIVGRDGPWLERASSSLLAELRPTCITLEGIQDSALAMVATALCYRVPPTTFLGRETLGIIPPAACLAAGWGDCDSKSYLLAALIGPWRGADGRESSCLAVEIPGHLLLAVLRTPLPGQNYVEFNGLPYVLMETAGPGLLPVGSLGQSTSDYVAAGGHYTLRPCR